MIPDINGAVKKLSEEKCTLKHTCIIGDAEMTDVAWVALKSKYDSVTDPCGQVVVSLLNAILFQKRAVFALTRKVARELVEGDKNWPEKVGFGNANWKRVLKIAHTSGTFKAISEGGPGRAAIYEVTSQGILDYIGVDIAAQRQQLTTFQSRGGKVHGKSDPSLAPGDELRDQVGDQLPDLGSRNQEVGNQGLRDIGERKQDSGTASGVEVPSFSLDRTRDEGRHVTPPRPTPDPINVPAASPSISPPAGPTPGKVPIATILDNAIATPDWSKRRPEMIDCLNDMKAAGIGRKDVWAAREEIKAKWTPNPDRLERSKGPEGWLLAIEGDFGNAFAAVYPATSSGTKSGSAHTVQPARSVTSDLEAALEDGRLFPTVSSKAELDAFKRSGVPKSNKAWIAFKAAHPEVVAAYEKQAEEDCRAIELLREKGKTGKSG